MGGYNTWESKLEPYGDEEWMDYTSLEFNVDGTTYGFPVAVEAWGMAYNTAMLDQAGVDPASLTSQEAYREAFEKIDAMKDELGIDSVVAMAAGPDMRWVTGLHNFNGYLSAGLPYGDTTVLDKLNNGEADMDRLTEYADWVELLFEYSDKTVLLTGNYDAQVGQFGTEKAAFIHQGNWIDPWLADNGVDFEMAFAPHASVYGEHNAIFIGAPSYYVINNESDNIEAARDFINYIAMNEAGHNYMVNEAKMVPAFTNVTLTPDAPLSANAALWLAKEDGSYTWLQNDMPDGFGMGTIAPIYELFASGVLSKEQFIDQLKSKIEDIK
jgi:raffinose/stachyose/melibiose transport system substrate-binding protein